MAGYNDPFKLINDEAELIEKNKPIELAPQQVEAFQIVRVTKNSNGEHRREILDTIMVYKQDVDLAKINAKKKAERLGNCMVIQKMEEVIATYHEKVSTSEDDNFRYKPFRGRKN